LKNLATAAWPLLLDTASTIFFLIVYGLTKNIVLSVALGILLAAFQITWRIVHHLRIDALQWVSLLLVLASGVATLATRDPIFVMFKPTVIYLLVGLAMLQKGWMVRYMPPRALEAVPDLVNLFGLLWAALMFFSAAFNLLVAVSCGLLVWASVMAAWGIASKLLMFLLQYATMRLIARRRYFLRGNLGTP